MPDTATPRLGLVAPLGADQINQGDDSLRALVARLDAVLAPMSSGLFANRPPSSASTPGIVDRRYYATDLGISLRDTGTGWVAAGGTIVDTIANRPAASADLTGARFIATDVGFEWQCVNLAWVLVGVGIGQMIEYVGPGDLTTDLVQPDGRTLASSAYPTLDALIGAAAPAGRTHLWNGGTSPGSGLFRLPDLRGRASIPPDNMGTARGAANVIPNSSRTMGQSGGEERHLLIGVESGVKAHSHTASQVAHHHGFAGGATALNAGGGYNAFSPGSGVAVGTTTQTDDQTPAITVNNATAQNADNAHNNMQPYAVTGRLIRVI